MRLSSFQSLSLQHHLPWVARAGEAGGLRVPPAGVDAAGQPATAAWGALFVAAASECEGRGADACEPALPPPLAGFEGAAAEQRAAALRRLPGLRRGNRPHASSVPALAQPPIGASATCGGTGLLHAHIYAR